MNKVSAMEWLTIAFHDIKSAQILYDVGHYTDSIGSDLQQAIEKSIKAILAFKNQKIPKSHDLFEIYCLLDNLSLKSDEIDILHKATEYYKEDRYPNPNYSLPPREEIKEVLEFGEKLFDRVCVLLDIDKNELL